MTTFQEVSVNQQNLMRLEPKGGINSSNFCYFFKLRCYNCNETSKEVTLHVDINQCSTSVKCAKMWEKSKCCPIMGNHLFRTTRIVLRLFHLCVLLQMNLNPLNTALTVDGQGRRSLGRQLI